MHYKDTLSPLSIAQKSKKDIVIRKEHDQRAARTRTYA